MDDNTVSIKIRLEEAQKFAGEVRAASMEIDGLGDAAARADKKSKGASSSVGSLQKEMQKFQKTAGVIALLGLFAQLSSVATAGSLGFIGALAPMVGLLGAVPGLALLGAQGLGVLKLGLSGVTGAVGGLNAQMNPTKFAALSPQAQRLAMALNSMKAPILELQKRIQAGLLPGLTKGLTDARPVIAALSGPLAGTARVFGQFAASLGKLVGSKGFLADLRSQAQFNNTQIGKLGNAALHLFDALRQVSVAARPLVAWLVQLIDGWSKTADQMARNGRESGSLQRFFREVAETTGEVLTILGNVVGALVHIGSIGKAQIGDSFLGMLVRVTGEFRKWTDTASGREKITAWFQGAKGVFSTLGPAVVNLVKAFGQLGAAGAMPVLQAEAGVLANILDSVSWIIKNVPGGAQAVTGLASAFYLFSKFKILSIIGAIPGALRAITVATGMATAAGATELGTMELIEAAATGMWLAITGPVGLALLAIAAVTAAFVVLYDKVGWFHDGVNDVWAFFKAHWPLLTGLILAPFTAGFSMIIPIIATIINHATGLINTVIGGINDLIGAYDAVAGVFGLPKIGKLGMIGGGKPAAVSPATAAAQAKTAPALSATPTLKGSPFTAPSLTAPHHAKVARATGQSVASAATHTHVHVTTPLYLDGAKVAENQSKVIARHEALA